MFSFSQRFRELRKARGWTQQETADRLGIPRSTVANYERGRVPDEEMLKKIARLFDTTVDYLLGNTNEREAYESPDLLEILKNQRPHFRGIPVTEEQAEILLAILETYYKKKIREKKRLN